VKDGQSVEKGRICKWDPYNGLSFWNSLKLLTEDLEQGQSFMVEIDEQTGFKKSNF
jgi:DNA-directed RNA polymerase subunit beta'